MLACFARCPAARQPPGETCITRKKRGDRGRQGEKFSSFPLLFPNLKRNWKSYRGCLAPFFLFSAVVALLASLLLRCVFLYADVMLALLRLAPPPTPPSSRCAFPNLSSSTAPIDARGGAQARWSRFQFFSFLFGFFFAFSRSCSLSIAATEGHQRAHTQIAWHISLPKRLPSGLFIHAGLERILDSCLEGAGGNSCFRESRLHVGFFITLLRNLFWLPAARFRSEAAKKKKNCRKIVSTTGTDRFALLRCCGVWRFAASVWIVCGEIFLSPAGSASPHSNVGFVVVFLTCDSAWRGGLHVNVLVKPRRSTT